MASTSIEWTEATWNPIVGCSVVSPGCTNCYAMKMAARIDRMQPGGHYAGTTQASKAGTVWTGKVALAPERVLTAPLRRKKPTTYFVNSMGDLFHENVPDHWIDRVFAIMALTPQHTYQVLTKRAERMLAYVSDEAIEDRLALVILNVASNKKNGIFIREGILDWPEITVKGGEWDDRDWPAGIRLKTWPLPNVWLGVSVEDQTRADERIPHLLATPAAIRFVSAEPLLGPLDILKYTPDFSTWLDGLDWVICGGESGPGARPMHPDWARSLRDQCAAAQVPFFFKQWGEWANSTDEWPTPLCVEDFIFRAGGEVLGAGGRHKGTMHGSVDCNWRERGGAWMSRVGKKRSGRLLDGRIYDGMPGAEEVQL